MERRRTYTRKNKQENAGSQSHNATSHCQFTYKILRFYLEQLLRNLLRKIKVLIAWRERKDNKYKDEQTGQSWLSFPPYKYELFILYSCGDIFAEKCGEKEKRTYTRKNKQENASSQSHDATSHCQLTFKILTFYFEQLLRNLLQKIAVLTAWRERKEYI